MNRGTLPVDAVCFTMKPQENSTSESFRRLVAATAVTIAVAVADVKFSSFDHASKSVIFLFNLLFKFLPYFFLFCTNWKLQFKLYKIIIIKKGGSSSKQKNQHFWKDFSYLDITLLILSWCACRRATIKQFHIHRKLCSSLCEFNGFMWKMH